MDTLCASPPAPGTQVMRRAHGVLRQLALHNRDGLRVTDIARSLGLEPPTAHRILQGLVQERMAVQDAADKRYFLGPALVELGLSASARFPWRELVQPSAERLARLTGDTVVVTVRSGADGVCVEHKSGEFPIRASMVTVGSRRPLGAGAGGLAILSRMGEAECARIVRANAAELGREAAALARSVAQARLQGFAVNSYQRTPPGIVALGVPVDGAYAECSLGISVVAVSMRLSGTRRNEVLSWLQSEAKLIAHALAQACNPAV